MYKIFNGILLVLFLLLLSGCSRTNELTIETPIFTGRFELVPEMKKVSGLRGVVAYQEISDTKEKDTKILDSLIISPVHSSLSLTAYLQQGINQLKLNNYRISNEKTKKLTLNFENKQIPAILKTFTLIGDEKRYVAQYAVAYPSTNIIISYMTQHIGNRDAFIDNKKNLNF